MKEVIAALEFVSPDERSTWLKVGMAIKSEHGNEGFAAWNDWSKRADSYKPQSAKEAWRSFKADGGVTIRSLFYLAREAGWTGEGAPKDRTDEAIARANRERQVAISKRRQEHAEAALRAAKVLSESVIETHPYLERKGFPDQKMYVWYRGEEQRRLIIPLRIGRVLSSIQIINEDGAKRFLSSGRASGAEYRFGRDEPGAVHVLCEGWATGLTVAKALKAANRPAVVHVAFSCGNLPRIAHHTPRGLVVADHDASGAGVCAAKETGWPYWMSPVEGEDANDYYLRLGMFSLREALRKALKGV